MLKKEIITDLVLDLRYILLASIEEYQGKSFAERGFESILAI
jgi:hypothetical protein